MKESRNQRKHRERQERRAVEVAAQERAAREAAELAAQRETEAAARKARQEAEARAYRDLEYERNHQRVNMARGGAYCWHGNHQHSNQRLPGYTHPHGKPRPKRRLTPLEAVLLIGCLS